MKKLTLLFLFACALFEAQNQRFMYEYKFVSDSTKKDEISKELMYLDISKDGSKFYSREVYVNDSIMTAQFSKQIKAGDGMVVDLKVMGSKTGKIRYKINKEYPNFKVFSFLRSGMDQYNVTDDRPMDWKISAEKQKIGNWDTQKATLNFGGRQWIAWFSTEIPFSDGPYKFHGLPGLIVKMEDQTKSHIFELKGATKFETPIEQVSEFVSNGKAIEINQKQYKKLFLENRKDPNKAMRMAFSNGAIIEMKDQNGTVISPEVQMKKIEARQKEQNKKDNNLIEIDLLK